MQGTLLKEKKLPLSVSSSFVHGLSTAIQPLKVLVSSVRSTISWGSPLWHISGLDEILLCGGFLNDSGNSLSGHSHTLQSRNMHIPSSSQKGQSHQSLTWGLEVGTKLEIITLQLFHNILLYVTHTRYLSVLRYRTWSKAITALKWHTRYM